MIAQLLLSLLFGLISHFHQPLLLGGYDQLLSRNPAAVQPDLEVEKAAVLAVNDHFYFYKKQAEVRQPIASISKLMTALVFLDNNPGWDNVYQISSDDFVEGGRRNLFTGERLSLRDLFLSSLVASDNDATVALFRSTGLSEEAFVAKMNEKAVSLGLSNTEFHEVTGLSDKNISTAADVAVLAQAAFSRQEIAEATRMPEYRFTTLDGRSKLVESTDYLLFDDRQDAAWKIIGGKTGYTEQAGYCFVSQVEDNSGRQIISVVLGSAGKNSRFQESRKLIDWIYSNYSWQK
jgi:D-alanyl-D-alanine carboxypeptidase